MDAAELQTLFDAFQEHGAMLLRMEPPPVTALGLVETWRVLRQAQRDGPHGPAFWVMARDVYWLGNQQATHIMKVLRAETGYENLALWTDRGIFQAEYIGGADADTVDQFRLYAARPDSGYEAGEKIQAQSLQRFIAALEAEGR